MLRRDLPRITFRARVGLLMLLCLFIAVVAGYARVMTRMHLLGVHGWTMRAAGPCQLTRQGYLACANVPADSHTTRTEWFSVWVKLTTLEVGGYHQWGLSDSASWVATQDSVRRAFARAGGTVLHCRTESIESDTGLAYELWRFRGHAIQLVAMHSRSHWIAEPPWVTNLMAVEGSRQSCELFPRRRFLTPAEMMQRVRDRLEF